MDVSRLKTPELDKLRELFRVRGFDLRFVGGCVRDTMLGLEPKDVDLHTDADPDQQIAIYQAAGVRFIETGLQHGTVTVVLDDNTYEITSLRRDAETDGRHARVIYTRDWTVDLERRDFTINAMSLGFVGDLLDPFNGLQALQEGLVEFVGDPEQRILEDYLRILRWFRFRGRFGLAMSYSARRAVQRLAPGLRLVSRERVWSEISRILAGDNGPWIMQELHQLGVAMSCDLPLDLEWTETAQAVHEVTRDPVTLMVALYGTQAYHILQKWKASRDQQDQARYLAMQQWGGRSPFWLRGVDGLRREWAVELAALRGMEPLDRAILESWEVPEFPVTGYDLIRMGMKPGPDYAPTLLRLKTAWADSGFALDRDQLLARVRLDS